jgi:hypothetical protein
MAIGYIHDRKSADEKIKGNIFYDPVAVHQMPAPFFIRRV